MTTAAHVPNRRTLLEQRAIVENAIGSARTVGEVWRLGERLDAIDRQLADRGSDGRP